MLDTVVIKVHNVKKHAELAKYLYTEKFVTKVYYRQIVPYNATRFIYEKYIRYSDTGKPYRLKTVGKLHIPSSHYHLAYDVVSDRDYIYFNFSIPKYLYGTNINQFVSSPFNPKFNMAYYSEYNNQVKMLYSRFMLFISNFFEENFSHVPIDYTDVEINRIDFCYNMIFPSKTEALFYLDQQKRILKKSERLKKGFTNYRTAISYQTSDLYFKIYHKGSEYEKNDRKEHDKINKDFSREFEGLKKDKEYEVLKNHLKSGHKVYYYDTKYLQDFSDRILRFELSLNNRLLSRIYNTKIIQKEVPTFKNKVERYKLLKRKSKDGQNTENLTKSELTEYKKLLSTVRKTRRFFVKINKEHYKELHISGTKYQDVEVKHFSERLMKECSKLFYSLVDRFTLKQLDDFETVMNRCKQHNIEVENVRKRLGTQRSNFDNSEKIKMTGKKISETKIALLLQLMQKNTIDEIKQMHIFSTRTLDRYIQDLRTLKIDTNHISKSIVTKEISFLDHYIEVQFNENKLFTNKFNKMKY
ncbi:MAG TPA: hypothetical protein DCG75_03615 [Bacteroidales bacterium]|nr:hypothetical protein [Bacteroidales bacterium]